MAWKCPQCGVDGLAEDLTGHLVEAGGCGYMKCPSGVALLCESSGRQVEARISSTFGAAALRNLEDPGLRFVSAEQFRLEKSSRLGGWLVTAVEAATNPTFLNGAAVDPEGALLKEGDQLSIKGLHFPLKVRLIP